MTWKNHPLASLGESFFGCVTWSRMQCLSLCAPFLHFAFVSRTPPPVLPFALHFSFRISRSILAVRAPALQLTLLSRIWRTTATGIFFSLCLRQSHVCLVCIARVNDARVLVWVYVVQVNQAQLRYVQIKALGTTVRGSTGTLNLFSDW